MTKQERHLWFDFLRDYPIKIYRQRRLGYYITDFYCALAKVAIELDGSQHYSDVGELHDRIRTNSIEQLGVTVVRISNIDVTNNFAGVCQYIDNFIQRRINPIDWKPSGFHLPPLSGDGLVYWVIALRWTVKAFGADQGRVMTYYR